MPINEELNPTASNSTTVLRSDLPGLRNRGKVRDIYDLGEHLMIVASDRISAFDVVMDQPVPGKGIVLTQISKFWFETLPACAPHHLEYVVDGERIPPGYEPFVDQLCGRASVCRKAEVLPVECVVRGYIVGGGWKEYRQTGAVSGVTLPSGLQTADKLPEPIFTPSTKADGGHDEPISFERVCDLIGRHRAAQVRDRSMAIYSQAADFAADRGMILADTKFEFGLVDGELMLIDEVLTPDSSRFWPADQWRPGENPPSFDKQFLRDYLETLDWDKQPPPPTLPDKIIEHTAARYAEARARLIGCL
jgi:phosphoribosylaminoimidazole-succinocarboxamide synthase